MLKFIPLFRGPSSSPACSSVFSTRKQVALLGFPNGNWLSVASLPLGTVGSGRGMRSPVKFTVWLTPFWMGLVYVGPFPLRLGCSSGSFGFTLFFFPPSRVAIWGTGSQATSGVGTTTRRPSNMRRNASGTRGIRRGSLCPCGHVVPRGCDPRGGLPAGQRGGERPGCRSFPHPPALAGSVRTHAASRARASGRERQSVAKPTQRAASRANGEAEARVQSRSCCPGRALALLLPAGRPGQSPAGLASSGERELGCRGSPGQRILGARLLLSGLPTCPSPLWNHALDHACIPGQNR